MKLTCLRPATLAIVRRPPPVDFRRGKLKRLPSYNPQQTQNPFQVDLRGCDLSQLDVSQRLADLLHASFDSKTRWPSTLPTGFDPERMMELGRDPGLGVRQLHAKGITGKGIGIGIIDATLLVDHTEYRDRLRLYEEIHNHPRPAEMHGPAVASIAVFSNEYIPDAYPYGLTAGAGIKYAFTGIEVGVDYAYRDVQFFDGNHTISLRLGF